MPKVKKMNEQKQWEDFQGEISEYEVCEAVAKGWWEEMQKKYPPGFFASYCAQQPRFVVLNNPADFKPIPLEEQRPLPKRPVVKGKKGELSYMGLVQEVQTLFGQLHHLSKVSSSEVREMLQKKGFFVDSTVLSTVLKRLKEKGLITKCGTKLSRRGREMHLYKKVTK